MHYGYLVFLLRLYALLKSILKVIYGSVGKNEIFFIGKSIHRNSNFPKEIIILNNLFIFLIVWKSGQKCGLPKNKPYLIHSILYISLCSLDKSTNHIFLIVWKCHLLIIYFRFCSDFFNVKLPCSFCSPLKVLLTMTECYTFMKVLHIFGKCK